MTNEEIIKELSGKTVLEINDLVRSRNQRPREGPRRGVGRERRRCCGRRRSRRWWCCRR